MSQPKHMTKKELVKILVNKLTEVMADQEKLRLKVEKIQQLLKMVMEEPDIDLGDDDLKMDDPMDVPTEGEDSVDKEEDEEDEKHVEFDGVVYKIGDVVQLKNSKTGKWKETGKLVKITACMAEVQPSKGGKTTRRKYGNFCMAQK